MAAAGKVCTGFSKPYVAKYSNAGGVVSYSGCMQLARGVSVSLSLDTTDDNNFYADNIVAETALSTKRVFFRNVVPLFTARAISTFGCPLGWFFVRVPL